MLSNGILSGIKFIYLYSVAAHLILNELEDASHMRNKKNLANLTLIKILRSTLVRLLTWISRHYPNRRHDVQGTKIDF